MRCSIALAVAAATGSLAQTSAAGNWSSSLDMEIDANTVDDADKARFCTGQFNTCEILCDRDTDENNCEDSDLSYECTCASNSSAPGLEYYTQTMPYFICTELWERCESENAGDSRGQAACKDDILSKCPTNDPPKLANSSDDDDEDEETSTTAEATTSTSSGSGSDATNDDVTTTESDDLAAPTLMPGNGAAAVAAIGVLAYML